MHHIDRLIASRMKGYTQTPSDHLWLLVENRLNMEEGQYSEKSVSKKLLEKIRITHS